MADEQSAIVPIGAANLMEPIAFATSMVERADGKITLALFNGAAEPECIALLECPEETALALWRNLSSVLERE